MIHTINAFKGEYAFLSNFYPSELKFQDYRYASVEHAFQAFKMVTLFNHERVRKAHSPGSAKTLARSLPKREDWDTVRNGVMLICLREKFFKSWDLGNMLLLTGDLKLVEGNTWGDTYWGVCRGKGENKLGQLLMQVRQELKDARQN